MDGRIGLISGAVFAGVLAAGALVAGPAGVNLNPVDGVASAAGALFGGEDENHEEGGGIQYIDTSAQAGNVQGDSRASYQEDEHEADDDEHDEHESREHTAQLNPSSSSNGSEASLRTNSGSSSKSDSKSHEDHEKEHD